MSARAVGRPPQESRVSVALCRACLHPAEVHRQGCPCGCDAWEGPLLFGWWSPSLTVALEAGHPAEPELCRVG